MEDSKMKEQSIKARLTQLNEQILQLRKESRLVDGSDILYYHSKIANLESQKVKFSKQLERIK